MIHSGVGGIKESDVMLAAASKAVIFGFHVRPEPAARKLAEREGVAIRTFDIVYELLDDAIAADARACCRRRRPRSCSATRW